MQAEQQSIRKGHAKMRNEMKEYAAEAFVKDQFHDLRLYAIQNPIL
jgi:hypothetical protein